MFITAQTFANNNPNMQIIGLFKNKAVVLIDGQQKVLKIGDTTATGFTLIEANSNKAVFEYKGKKMEYTLSSQINSSYKINKPKEESSLSKTVHIPLDKEGKYITTIKINGKIINALVDTGANVVSLSGEQATQLKIDYSKGDIVKVSTAGGDAKGYIVVLEQIALEGIKVKDVEATVINGTEPKIVLLGMSFLKKVTMKFDDKTKDLEISEGAAELIKH